MMSQCLVSQSYRVHVATALPMGSTVTSGLKALPVPKRVALPQPVPGANRATHVSDRAVFALLCWLHTVKATPAAFKASSGPGQLAFAWLLGSTCPGEPHP